jgi:hypothetical protein
MTGLHRVAVRVAMDQTARTAARPPRIWRGPDRLPRSSWRGAPPTTVALSRGLRPPHAGHAACRGAASTGPLPGAEWSTSSCSRQAGLVRLLAATSAAVAWSRPWRASICRARLSRTAGCARATRWRAATTMARRGRRRCSRASIGGVIASGRGRGVGRPAAATCAMTPASRAAVFAKAPVACATSRLWRGCITATGRVRTARAATTEPCQPPGAASTSSVGCRWRRCASPWARPARSCATRQRVSSGRQARARASGETALPTNRAGRVVRGRWLRSVRPHLGQARSGLGQRFGLVQAEA